MVYYLGLSNTLAGIDADLQTQTERDEYLRRLGEITHLFGSAGFIVITTISDLDDPELDMIDALNQPNDLLVVSIGENRLSRRTPDLAIADARQIPQALEQLTTMLAARNYISEYSI